MFNMGLIDRVVRILIALTVGVMIYLKVITGVWAIVLGILAGVFILTSLVGSCPLYMPFKISTKSSVKKKK